MVPHHASQAAELIAPLNEHSRSARPSQIPQARITWQKPLEIGSFLVLGISCTVGHHFYYNWLDGQVTRSSDHQQWAIRVGTAFAFLTTSCFKASVTAAYVQILWRVLRRHTFRIKDIDSLFTAVSSLRPFFSFRLYPAATLALLAAFVVWALPVAAIFPPATLSVSLTSLAQTTEQQVPTIFWPTRTWSCSGENLDCISENVLKIASQTAQSGEILPLYAPAVNSSYSLKFLGPSLSCRGANQTQKAALQHYAQRTAIEENVFALSLINGTVFNSTLNATDSVALRFFSAFPVSTLGDYLDDPEQVTEWLAELGPDAYDSNLINENLMDLNADEIWIQLFDDEVVCTLENAEFDIRIETELGQQSVVVNKIQTLGPFYYNSSTSESSTILHDSAYETVFKAFVSMISGNLTMDTDTVLTEFSSDILRTNLLGCPEMNVSAWKDIVDSTLPWRLIEPEIPFQKFNNYSVTFPNRPWQCRNGSLSKGLEDLANNITISMLSFADVTTKVNVPVTVLKQELVYEYRYLNLVISYASAALASLLAVLGGFYALDRNGVVHDTNFSSLVATSRNPTLDKIFEGQSLGAQPFPKDVMKKKLRFGLLLNPQSSNTTISDEDKPEDCSHISFGIKDEINFIDNVLKHRQNSS